MINEKAIKLVYKVIRLPPYYCHYNLIKMVWNDVEKLFMDAMSSFKTDLWKKYDQHVEKDIDNDWTLKGLDEISVQKLVTCLVP